MLKEVGIDEFPDAYQPYITLPTKVSYLSTDKKFNYNFEDKIIPILDEDALKNNSPKLNILSGFDEYQMLKNDTDKNEDTDENEETEERNPLFSMLLDIKAKKISFPIKFITNRMALTDLTSSPYKRIENLVLLAINLNGNIFLWDQWDEVGETRKQSEYFKKYRYAANRLKKLITKTQKDDNDDCFFNPYKFYTAVRTELCSDLFHHHLLYMCFVDCIRERDNKYVEIKSRIIKQNDNSLKKFHFLNWWLESFFNGIETVIVGFRNDDFIVEEIKEYRTKDFYNMSRNSNDGEGLWSPDKCFSFLGNFLNEVETLMEDFCESDILVIDLRLYSRKIIFKKTNQYESPKYDFLPSWFRNKWKD